MGPNVHTDAGKKDRSLVKGTAGPRREVVRVELLFWVQLISKAVDDAKKTKDGLPTALAVMARYWIEEDRPKQQDRYAWETCFEAACSWLSRDADQERKRICREIDACWMAAWAEHVRLYVLKLRPQVMRCAGMQTSPCEIAALSEPARSAPESSAISVTVEQESPTLFPAELEVNHALVA